jgi:hypothetical protein
LVFYLNYVAKKHGRKFLPHVRFLESFFPCYMLHATFFFGLFFDPEDGGDMFLRIVL